MLLDSGTSSGGKTQRNVTPRLGPVRSRGYVTEARQSGFGACGRGNLLNACILVFVPKSTLVPWHASLRTFTEVSEGSRAHDIHTGKCTNAETFGAEG